MRTCSRCVMNDNSDKTISFDQNGYCNYCSEQLSNIGKVYFPNEEGQKRLEQQLKKIKKDGEGKDYDCIMGLSGGLDSSYLAYLGYKWDLRILAIHIDDGFDTEISKNNIEKLVRATGVHLETIKPDTEQYISLVKAYMRAGVPNIAVPQDNILFAFLYDVAAKKKINYFLSGGNFALECILQQGNTYNAMDVVNIKDINRRFGTKPIDKLKFISSYRKYINMKLFNLQTVRPLNNIDYNRDKAFKELYDFCGFEYYGRKHLENIFTAFLQLYWFPKKFNVDKRTSHLSSMIVSGQMTRKDALEELKTPMFEDTMMQEYIEMIKEHLCISDTEFEQIMSAPVHAHEEYRTDKLAVVLRKVMK